MKIEQQVCSNTQAKRLKELGVPQHKSYFAWCIHCPDPTGEHEGYSLMMSSEHALANQSEHLYDMPTSTELGWMLVINDDTYFTNGGYNEHLGCWCVDLQKRDMRMQSGFKLIHNEEGESEAECRAEMLIWLLEQKIQKVENCDLSNASI